MFIDKKYLSLVLSAAIIILLGTIALAESGDSGTFIVVSNELTAAGTSTMEDIVELSWQKWQGASPTGAHWDMDTDTNLDLVVGETVVAEFVVTNISGRDIVSGDDVRLRICGPTDDVVSLQLHSYFQLYEGDPYAGFTNPVPLIYRDLDGSTGEWITEHPIEISAGNGFARQLTIELQRPGEMDFSITAVIPTP